jgi:hypothetical protein
MIHPARGTDGITMGKPLRPVFRILLFCLLIASLGTWGLLQYEAHQLARQTDADAYSQIEEGLYQGRAVVEPPPGTGAVLNLCESKDPYECDVHRWVPIPDAAPAPSLAWLRQQVAFVAEQREAGRTVYVHCAAGVSRSGMVVVAYEMKKHGWSHDEALAFVRTRRPVTNPNPAFRELLLEWEKELKQAGVGPPEQ